LQEDTQDLLATVAAASQGQQQPDQLDAQQQAQQQQQQQQFAGAGASSGVQQATAWQEEVGDDETESGLPDDIQLVRPLLLYTCYMTSDITVCAHTI
jgi:hypothetical protein